MSGLSLSAVACCKTFWTRPWLLLGFFKKSLTAAVRICSCVYADGQHLELLEAYFWLTHLCELLHKSVNKC